MDFRRMNGDKSILLGCQFMDDKERKDLINLIKLSKKWKQQIKKAI